MIDTGETAPWPEALPHLIWATVTEPTVAGVRTVEWPFFVCLDCLHAYHRGGGGEH